MNSCFSFLWLIVFRLLACVHSSVQNLSYNELYRPGYHFSPPQNWMNDPNGLVFFEGEYHLFYQYNPYGQDWGHMSWGHAISTDLVHWTNLPLAIPEYDDVMIFSGSAIVDKNNTSGLCTSSQGCLIAIYTASSPRGQAQALAFSNDKGRTWTEYPKNPIIDENLKEFRDPKVFWYEQGKKWIMATVLATQHQVRFYESRNLINWSRLSEFGPAGDVDGVWECPDLFPLQREKLGGEKWVLSVSLAGRGQYFLGDFNGTHFINSNSKDLILLLDEGKDQYAAVTWNNNPDNRRIMIGWMNNWEYAGAVPTKPWRGQFSLLRELRLRDYPEGIRLVQSPINEVMSLRNSPKAVENIQLNKTQSSILLPVQGQQYEIIAYFSFSENQADTPTEFGVKVFVGDQQETLIGYSTKEKLLFVDRTRSGVISFSKGFPARTTKRMEPEGGIIELRIFIDQSSVEVFGNRGKVSITNIIFPDPQKNKVTAYVVDGSVQINLIETWSLSTIW